LQNVAEVLRQQQRISAPEKESPPPKKAKFRVYKNMEIVRVSPERV
jgi:hypothetical protein